MERTTFQMKQPSIDYDINEEPIILSKGLSDLILRQKNKDELITLYWLYYYTAKWQKTNQPKATTEYVAKKLEWSDKKVRRVKKRLIQLGLILNVIKKDSNNQITGHFIRVKFIWSSATPEVPTRVDVTSATPEGSHRVENLPLYSLSTNKEDALSTNKDISPHSQILNPSMDNNENKPSIKERNKLYQPIARYLSTIIQSKKNIHYPPHIITGWTNEIRQLCENYKIPIPRVKKVLEWYAMNIGGEYIPVIESGAALKLKFTKLEDAIQRSTGRIPIQKKTIGSKSAGGISAQHKEYDEVIKN